MESEHPESTPNLSSSAQTSSPQISKFTQFQGFYFRPHFIPNIISFQKHFQALDDDIIVASKPKAGTTWLKALVFTILNRNLYTLYNTPLTSANPHELVPFFEINLFNQDPIPDLTTIQSPRLFATHLPYQMLADSIKHSNCRIVYIIRNPLDIIVSFWHFLESMQEIDSATWPLEECFELFCRGEEGFGPFWDQVLGYWKESLEKPWKVLFLKYEELKQDTVFQVKRLAEFLGFPFSMEEEKTGVVEQIADFCSFRNLKDLEVNKTGKIPGSKIPSNKVFFRTGKVGDYVNHLNPCAVERFNNILEEKLNGSGLTFKFS